MDVTASRSRRGLAGLLHPPRERTELVGAWFEAEYPALLRFAYFVSADRAAAEDLVQDAFERVWRAAGRLHEPTIGAFVRKTVLNLARSRFRRTIRERRALDVYDRAAHAPGPDPSTHDEVWRAIATLTAQQRACIALRYYEDMSEAEVAETLGLSPGTVKSHTNRAMTKLREMLGDRAPEPEGSTP